MSRNDNAAAWQKAQAQDASAETEKPKRKKLTIEQKIAQSQAQLARLQSLRQKSLRDLRTRELILIGTAFQKAMQDDPGERERLIGILKTNLTRDIDKAVIASWLSRTFTPE